MPFEVLRSEYDAFGYDVVIEANRVVRHVQLKAITAAGTRAHVNIQVALADKPGGCVVWIFVDPLTLQLGPFLWFGGAAGASLPALGDRVVRHTKGDAVGVKKVRARLRRLPKGMFQSLPTMRDLAMVMFVAEDQDHAGLLAAHLASRRAAIGPEDFRGLTWDKSDCVAYAIDAYALAEAAGLGHPIDFTEQLRAQAEAEGNWSGTALELWVALFIEHRRDRIQSQGLIGIPGPLPSLPLLDELCQALSRSYLASVGH